MLGSLAFLSPWALAALAVLPALWWLLRVTPPAPRTLRFPAVRLLFGLQGREDAAARTPPWVLALRLGLAACIILAAARPVLDPARPLPGSGPLLVVVDDGWAAARDWRRRLAWLDELLGRAEAADRPVMLLATAPAEDGSPPTVQGMMPAGRARTLVRALHPQPWPVDRAAAARAVAALPAGTVAGPIWLADGVEDSGAEALGNELRKLGGGLLVVEGQPGHVLGVGPAVADPKILSLRLRRPGQTDDPEITAVRAVDDAGRVLARQEVSFGPGQAEAEVAVNLPTELRNKVARLDVENEQGAAAVLLTDERWRRRPVGLAAGGMEAAAPLLGSLTYVDKALAPVAEVSRGNLAELLDKRPAMLVLADLPSVPLPLVGRLGAWVEGGGVLVRFAGPLLAQAVSRGAEDRFLPVRLLSGGRNLGGVLSWTTPQPVGPFAASGPFAGLAVPDDVKVTAQVLAEPSLELAGRTWASLADGTPLVTARPQGRGWVVLVHTTANPDWSTLAMSGLFPEMLHRLVLLSQGVAGRPAGPLAPIEVMDGMGRLAPPAATAAAIDGDLAQVQPGPRHPPGLYGAAGARVAINLGPLLGRPGSLSLPAGAERRSIEGTPVGETSLAGPLLALAALLAILDLAVALLLRGLLRRAALPIVALAAILAAHSPARAADDEDFALRAAGQTRLAYVRTGDSQVDGKSQAGLAGLTRVLADRSTAVLAAPMAVDLEHDPVLFFPLLYWPVTASQPSPSPAAVERLQSYLRHGGLIVLDTADGGGADAVQGQRLQALAGDLGLPPLAPLSGEHVLYRSFYLLREAPGRYDGAPVWVAEGSGNDAVSPVVVGGNDWAGAWADDGDGHPLYAAVPGGERQRETALRFGVNLVMYALTGTYKADQVHLPAIMERLGR